MFLTLEDPRARVKGSRDPLGAQPIWSSFGRRLVTNLTTVSDSIRGFSTLLLARYCAERLLDEGAIEEDGFLGAFLRFEQLAGYARYCVHQSDDVRGIDRIRRRVSVGASDVVIDEATGQILSNQKIYGLWGFFTVAARVSGLLEEGNSRLTPEALSFLETESRADQLYGSIRRSVAAPGVVRIRPPDNVLQSIAKVLPPTYTESERSFYGSYLRDGAHVREVPDPQRQGTLRRLLETHLDLESELRRNSMTALAGAARGVDAGLALSLDRVLRLEALLAPCSAIFQYLQARHGQAVSDVAQVLRDRWGSIPHLDSGDFNDLEAECIQASSEAQWATLRHVHECLRNRDFPEAILGLLAWNRVVMEQRESAPWIRAEQTPGHPGSQQLDVRFRGLEHPLPDADELADLWRFPYFLPSLMTITRQLQDPVR
jgi:hypothetical protein